MRVTGDRQSVDLYLGEGCRQKTPRHKKQGLSSEKKGTKEQTTQQVMIKKTFGQGKEAEEGLGYRFGEELFYRTF